MSQFFGASPVDTAKKCFAENLRQFSNSATEPEKYNLYNGLANLEIAREQMQNDIDQLKQYVAALANQKR